MKYTKFLEDFDPNKFIDNPEYKLTVDHIDKNKQNNCVTNLRWATMREQNLHVNKDVTFMKIMKYRPVYRIHNDTNEIIYLHGPIKGNETLYSIMTAIRVFTKYRTEEEKNDPVTISLNSPGGDIYEMNGIIDYINSLSFKVNVVCRGQAISAGAWILAMGTGLRAMSKYSTLMLHEGSYSMDDKFHNMKTSLEHFKNLEMIGYKMLEEKTGIESKFWEDKCKQDWYLTAEEALTLKLIDKII